MKQLLLAAAVFGVLVACGKSSSPGYGTSAGSLALSRDEQHLYAVDTDNAILAVIDTQTNAKVAQVSVGAGAERVAVGSDDTIYVSNRGARSVSVIAPGTWQETARIPVGVEPVGLAVSPDGKTLYVVNATALDTPAQGSVMAIDPRTQQLLWEVKVGEEPRGIALIDSHTAAVTLFKQGGLAFVNLDNPSAPSSAAPAGGVLASDAIYGKLNQSRVNGVAGGSFSSFHPRALTDVTISPDGARLYTTTILAREDAIALPPSVVVPYYSEGGPCGLGSVATPGLITWDVQAKQPLVDDVTACSYAGVSSTENFPPTILATPTVGTPIQGPHVSVVDPTNSWIFVVNLESNNVAILSTTTRDGSGTSFGVTGSSLRALVSVGHAPNGIALTSDGTKAYVYNSFDHTVSTLVQDTTQSPATVVELTDSTNTPTRIAVAGDAPGLSADAIAGRRMFFDATDARMNALTIGVSCNTCHNEGGREDGHTWGFPDGSRNTPSLAGRMMLQTAPYHWSGEFADLNSFLDHTVQARMGGSGLGDVEHAQISAFIGSMQLPDNPLRLATPTAAQARGAQVFLAAACSSCHAGTTMTNNGFAQVGTLNTEPNGLIETDQIPAQGFNVPSLLGLGRTAPYLHDGTAATLQDRIQLSRGTGTHGNLQNVTDDQVSDLVAYLQSL
jgi:YVTN family beta-propeller protein